MNLIRFQRPSAWLSPLERFDTLRDEINRLFDTPFRGFHESELFNGWTPALDVYEDKDHLMVKVELPGAKKEDINLSLLENTLTVSGELKSGRKETENAFSRTERFFGRFQRTVTLPKPVDPEKVTARYSDGILTIKLAKTEESKPKQIEVKAA
jgi:HSP20 family protein